MIFPLASFICVLHMVGNMSSQVRLRNFSKLFGGIIKWILGVTLAAFTVFLTVQGITSATYDGLSFKAAKYAVSNSVPIIGGFLGSGFDLVVAGSVLIKNSIGSCGIILLALVLLPPLIRLVVCSLFMRLSRGGRRADRGEGVFGRASPRSAAASIISRRGLLAVDSCTLSPCFCWCVPPIRCFER